MNAPLPRVADLKAGSADNEICGVTEPLIRARPFYASEENASAKPGAFGALYTRGCGSYFLEQVAFTMCASSLPSLGLTSFLSCEL